MAGTSDDFDSDTFRADIVAAMTMGAAVSPGQRATFHWNAAKTYAKADAGGRPWDFADAPTATESVPADQQVPCAIIPAGGQTSAGAETSFGTIDEDRVVVLLLDEQYALVGTFDEVTVAGCRYKRKKELDELALHDVAVHQILVEAVDQS